MEWLNVCYLFAMTEHCGTLRKTTRRFRTTAGLLLRELGAELGERPVEPTCTAPKARAGRDDRRTPRKAGSAEGLGTEKPRRAPGVWRSKNM
jgi:hypothetical protein